MPAGFWAPALERGAMNFWSEGVFGGRTINGDRVAGKHEAVQPLEPAVSALGCAAQNHEREPAVADLSCD